MPLSLHFLAGRCDGWHGALTAAPPSLLPPPRATGVVPQARPQRRVHIMVAAQAAHHRAVCVALLPQPQAQQAQPVAQPGVVIKQLGKSELADLAELPAAPVLGLGLEGREQEGTEAG